MVKRLEFVWPADLVDRLDRARGEVPRTVWVRGAVEGLLSGETRVVDPVPVDREKVLENLQPVSRASAFRNRKV